MAWFRVDDGFWCHPKVLACPAPSVALWVRGGSWSAAQLTDGFVPRTALGMLGARPRDADALVAAGLWVVVPEGWRFHGWEEFQPSRDEVLGRRAKTAERVRRFRERKREEESTGDPTAEPDPGPDPGDNGDANDPGNALVTLAPARPDPTRPTNPLLAYVGRLAGSDASVREGLPAEVIAAWQDRAGPDVDLVAEARAYLARYGTSPARNPGAAWLGWLDRARDRAAAATAAERRRTACPDPECRGGWLPAGDDDRPRPCRHCRPHIRPAEEAS